MYIAHIGKLSLFWATDYTRMRVASKASKSRQYLALLRHETSSECSAGPQKSNDSVSFEGGPVFTAESRKIRRVGDLNS